MAPKMISLPALPAMVAGRALKADTAAAAQRALDQAKRLLAWYDLTLGVMDELADATHGELVQVLQRRLLAANRATIACHERLDDATEFCRSLDRVTSPVAMVEVPSTFFEMLSPYLDDAMEPVLQAISRRVGSGCSTDEVEAYFPKPKPTLAA